jgi:hypothetical protein
LSIPGPFTDGEDIVQGRAAIFTVVVVAAVDRFIWSQKMMAVMDTDMNVQAKE